MLVLALNAWLQVIDIKDARIDSILHSMSTTMLLHLPQDAVNPFTFYEDNLILRDEIGECNFIIRVKLCQLYHLATNEQASYSL